MARQRATPLMPRKPEGDRPLTGAEREARRRQRKAEREDKMRAAIEQALVAKTLQEARQILATAISP